MSECIFCKIVNGELPSSKIYEDKEILAFLDVQPVNPGHILIIPKKHSEFVAGVESKVLGDMFKLSKKVNQALRESGVKCKGIDYFLADGKEANQEMPHVHLHVFPRYKGDGFGFKFPKGYYGKQPSRTELNSLADQIKKLL
jgi:histidine triad (HIT) family protein